MKDTTIEPVRHTPNAPARRDCLRCKAPFDSSGFGERICRRCKLSSTWRTSPQRGAVGAPGRRR
ncbi:hypothetical protein SAMN04490244_103352 [Tranquillimonas rosea]|uniref:Uncharacterized protein n=1 Tax=Tranquillimonas rosea TaxID=641238 RepID=A0A1H9SSV2_9RHOB|nr:hypothetical protein [Tranquillimonas rosea]SER87483.1 hypothetical protein SAMN04490244_103352 [Tranquillimonas rosea]